MTSIAHKIAHLESYGFTVGPRDERLNTSFPGEFMVVEATRDDIGDYELPTADGSNGPWCIVGDDLTALVDEAHDQYLLSMTDDALATWENISAVDAADLPARKHETLLTPFIARSTYADIYLERETGKILRIDYEAMGGTDEWDDVAHFDPATLTADIGEDDVLALRFFGKDGTVYEPAEPTLSPAP